MAAIFTTPVTRLTNVQEATAIESPAAALSRAATTAARSVVAAAITAHRQQ
jgi:hypothetical protein